MAKYWAGFATGPQQKLKYADHCYTDSEKRHLENARYASKQDAGWNCKFSTLFQSHHQTE